MKWVRWSLPYISKNWNLKSPKSEGDAWRAGVSENTCMLATLRIRGNTSDYFTRTTHSRLRFLNIKKKKKSIYINHRHPSALYHDNASEKAYLMTNYILECNSTTTTDIAAAAFHWFHYRLTSSLSPTAPPPQPHPRSIPNDHQGCTTSRWVSKFVMPILVMVWDWYLNALEWRTRCFANFGDGLRLGFKRFW